MGNPKFVPTAEQRKLVETLASYGVPFTEIATLVVHQKTGRPVSDFCVRQHFGDEPATGMLKANACVAQSLFEMAVGMPAQYDSNGFKIRSETQRNVAAAIFWAKALMGWRETQGLEMSGKDGKGHSGHYLEIAVEVLIR